MKYTEADKKEAIPMKYTLTEAIDMVAKKMRLKVEQINAIQFEDGSGRRFNYQLKEYDATKENGWRYIEFGKFEANLSGAM
jgi:hypothetical protein